MCTFPIRLVSLEEGTETLDMGIQRNGLYMSLGGRQSPACHCHIPLHLKYYKDYSPFSSVKIQVLKNPKSS